MTSSTRCYGLVSSHEDVWQLYDACKERGVGARIAPTPRTADAHAACGTALMIDCAERDALQAAAGAAGVELLGIVVVEDAIDPHRDRYC